MPRLIDAEALKELFRYPIDYTDVYVKRMIDAAPTVEPDGWVAVVKCRDCVYSEPLKSHADLYNNDLMNCTCQHGEEARNVWHKYSKEYKDYSLVEPNDYCSFGEKPVSEDKP